MIGRRDEKTIAGKKKLVRRSRVSNLKIIILNQDWMQEAYLLNLATRKNDLTATPGQG